ncbi:MAG: methyltransferase [Saprospiraceae bacterium]|nr:methyltransferase [Saprospiraceae bacterium]
MNSTYTIERYPASSNRSLKAWSAADEYVWSHFNENSSDSSSVTILNDRFGYFAVHCAPYSPTVYTHYKSQEHSIRQNANVNAISLDKVKTIDLFQHPSKPVDFILMRVPKSMDLFRLFMIKAHQNAHPNSKVFCGFMTRNFTPQMLSIVSEYFDHVEQSLAKKKARVLTLSEPKAEVDHTFPFHTIEFTNSNDIRTIYKQYYGVFSAKHIDYATQFLLQYVTIDNSVHTILDLASGNGVIAHQLRLQHEQAEIHLMDDALLAIESSKLNLGEGNHHFHYANNLDSMEDDYFDLIVSNPPFHFEHENTIEIALQLFEGVKRILKSDGKFILVANLHLNYKTHLKKIFHTVEVLAINDKFEVICCS